MIHIQGISKGYGSKVLFNEASAMISSRSRMALVGPNGSGKTTLIRMILGQEEPDTGTVTHVKGLEVGHLAQEVPKFSGRTVLAEVLRVEGRHADLKKLKEEYEHEFAEHPDATSDTEKLERYGRILEELESLDPYRVEARGKEILMGMGFRERDFTRDLSEFSGGWLMRVALSRILLLNPDLLLLDEPTNHLDLESLLWLEDFLKNFQGALLMVSHDTAFLNRVVNEVLEIDQQKTVHYRGNISAFAEQKAERLEVLKSQFNKQQDRIADLEHFIERFGAKATKARQAQSRAKELERMERIELPEDRSKVRFRFPPAPHGGREVVTLANATIKFGDKVVLENLNWILQKGLRVAISGVNGAGKTTLLRLLSGTLAPTSGTFKFGHEVRAGYYAQLQAESLDLRKTVLEELWAVAPDMGQAQVRAIAGAFLFSGDAVEKKCAVLSGGEKARVAIAKLLLSPSNFLILDEPTNHLDVDSKAVLCEALANYNGTLVIVSHDRDFVSGLVDSVLELVPSGDSHKGSDVRFLLGSYDEFLARKLKEISDDKSKKKLKGLDEKAIRKEVTPVAPVTESEKPKAISNNQTRAWRAELEKTEKDITVYEKKQAALATELGDPAVYEDKKRSLALIEEQRTIAETLNKLLNRWEELTELLGG